MTFHWNRFICVPIISLFLGIGEIQVVWAQAFGFGMMNSDQSDDPDSPVVKKAWELANNFPFIDLKDRYTTEIYTKLWNKYFQHLNENIPREWTATGHPFSINSLNSGEGLLAYLPPQALEKFETSIILRADIIVSGTLEITSELAQADQDLPSPESEEKITRAKKKLYFLVESLRITHENIKRLSPDLADRFVAEINKKDLIGSILKSSPELRNAYIKENSSLLEIIYALPNDLVDSRFVDNHLEPLLNSTASPKKGGAGARIAKTSSRSEKLNREENRDDQGDVYCGLSYAKDLKLAVDQLNTTLATNRTVSTNGDPDSPFSNSLRCKLVNVSIFRKPGSKEIRLNLDSNNYVIGPDGLRHDLTAEDWSKVMEQITRDSKLSVAEKSAPGLTPSPSSASKD